MLMARACRFLGAAMQQEQIDVSGVMHECRDGSADNIVSTLITIPTNHTPARHNHHLAKLATRTRNKCFCAVAALLETSSPNSNASWSGMYKDEGQ